MTTDELQSLRPGDRVRFTGGIDHPRPATGQVYASDSKCVEIWWPDGTSTLIWFRHAEDGRDGRHANLTKCPPQQKKSS